MSIERNPDAPRWLPGLNMSGEDIPPFSLVVVDGCEDNGTYHLYKPDEESVRAWITGPITIPVDSVGCVTRDWPAYAAYTGGPPEPGETWGAAADSWVLTSGKSGFTIKGTAAESEGIVQVEAEDKTGGGGAGNLTVPFDNLIINSNFNVFQRLHGGEFVSGNYTFDRWFVLSDAGNITATRGTITNPSPPAGTHTIGHYTQKSGGNSGFLVGQWIADYRMNPWIDANLTFSITARVSINTAVLHYAVFERANSNLSINIVNSWDGNHTPQFDTGNTTLVDSGCITISNTTWQTGTLDYIPTSTGCTTIVACWVEGLGNNTSLYLAKASLSRKGSEWEEPKPEQEWLRCAEFFWNPRFTRLECTPQALLLSTANVAEFMISRPFDSPTLMLGSGNVHLLSSVNSIGLTATSTVMSIQHLPSSEQALVTGGNQTVSAGNLTLQLEKSGPVRSSYEGYGTLGYQRFNLRVRGCHTGILRGTGLLFERGDYCIFGFQDSSGPGPTPVLAISAEVGE